MKVRRRRDVEVEGMAASDSQFADDVCSVAPDYKIYDYTADNTIAPEGELVSRDVFLCHLKKKKNIIIALMNF